MFSEGLEKAGAAGVLKSDTIRNNLAGFFILSLCAGFYIGAAMFISCVIGSRTPDSPGKFLMGLGFSVGLIFVVFAGAELFTGNVLTMTLSCLLRKVSVTSALYVLCVSFAGNLAGGWITALLARYSGLCSGAVYEYMLTAAEAKSTIQVGEMVVRALLCNIFVTLGIWMNRDGATRRQPAKAGRLYSA